MKIFYDSEFTGLHQQTTLISLGLVTQDGHSFYAEFSDFNRSQCDEWIVENVLNNTRWLAQQPLPAGLIFEHEANQVSVCGDRSQVTEKLREWLQQFNRIEIWADTYAYDWVLFCELFGGARHVPENISYIPLDLSTLFKLKGLDVDTDREAFAPLKNDNNSKHNALYDALITKNCYQKLMTI